MAGVAIQITFDAADPERLGGFWREVLGYVEQPPPAGYQSWDAFLDAVGIPADQRGGMYAVVDPEGVRPRLLFQRVPEGKTAKNRMHLDVNVAAGLSERDGRDAVRQRANELIGLGAAEVRESTENGEYWIVMQDPEGNEFCAA
jgi:hypothetical protein